MGEIHCLSPIWCICFGVQYSFIGLNLSTFCYGQSVPHKISNPRKLYPSWTHCIIMIINIQKITWTNQCSTHRSLVKIPNLPEKCPSAETLVFSECRTTAWTASMPTLQLNGSAYYQPTAEYNKTLNAVGHVSTTQKRLLLIIKYVYMRM